jgi:hypothetical protein
MMPQYNFEQNPNSSHVLNVKLINIHQTNTLPSSSHSGTLVSLYVVNRVQFSYWESHTLVYCFVTCKFTVLLLAEKTNDNSITIFC